MNGERAAVEAVLAEVGEEDEAEQLGLFAPPVTEEGRRRQLVKRGPGRPPGARNKRTERTVQFLLARHRDPREVLLEIAGTQVEDLAALLGCTLLEALQERRLAAVAVLPYVAQRQPLAIDVTNRQVVYLTINEGQLQEAGAGDGIGVTARVIENVEFQEVSAEEAARVGQSRVGQLEEDVEKS